MALEHVIINHLVTNEKFTRRTLPFLKLEYFHAGAERVLFEMIANYVNKYNRLPTKETLFIDFDKVKGVDTDTAREVSSFISMVKEDTDTDLKWLVDQTEGWCQDMALDLALSEAVAIRAGEVKDKDRGAIPKILTDALAVSFDVNIGHDYLENWEDRFKYYHTPEARIPFDIEYFNRVTNGGLPGNSLTLFIAITHGGKSLIMNHMAAANLCAGKNVLYITLELSHEETGRRIDANLFNVHWNEVEKLSHEDFEKKIAHMRKRTHGKLVIKFFPTKTAGVGHFRHVLNELRIKKNFVPDIIYIDYLNNAISMHIRRGFSNSYELIKAVAFADRRARDKARLYLPGGEYGGNDPSRDRSSAFSSRIS